MKKNNDIYNFDSIISNEDFKKNRERCLKQDLTKKKKLKLKKWVKDLLWIILGAIIGITIYQLFTIHRVYETPVGSYTCRGGIIKACVGSNEVADYLGV